MKARWKVAVGLAFVAALCALLLWRAKNDERTAAEATRRALRQQGFKTDLADFDFSTPPQTWARIGALTNLFPPSVPRSAADYARRSALLESIPDLQEAVGSNAALVIWRQVRLPGDSGEDQWQTLREVMTDNRADLDAACEAALAGPIRFNLNASAGHGLLLPHLASLKQLARVLATRVMLELHDGHKDEAWTNLLAATRLATAWEPEPVEISHLVRFACTTIAFDATWQALQTDGWEDDRLTQLQREWESVDFFKGLPETAAFARASAVATCRLERQQPVSRPTISAKDVFRSPRNAWDQLTYYRRQIDYRHRGTYEDEKALLLHYRDRELELRRAIQCSTWSEMRWLPGVTNIVPFRSNHPSAMQTLLNSRQLQLAWTMYAQSSHGSQIHGFLGRAADAEARRRLLLTAIALERYRGRHGSYPNALQELAPELLKDTPTDFMDGKPLRYHRTNDGHFVLYSAGLDCTDNGGLLPQPSQREFAYYVAPRKRIIPPQSDLVWPRPASVAEVENFGREQLKARAEATDRVEDYQAEQQWRYAAERQGKVEKLLSAKAIVRPTERVVRGRPLSALLLNEKAARTNSFTLNALLTLKQVTTGEEPETVTFETPINYDVLTNLGALYLLVDPVRDEDSDEGCLAGHFECRRATNGNCLLVWSTIYESPGKHALQLGLELRERDHDVEFIAGPLSLFAVTNLCQLSLSSAYFNPAFGATLRAKLPESNGTYSVEITSTLGELLKTITGRASNGVVKVHWDLVDEHGRKCTNNAFGTLIHIALPKSGRKQTLMGP